MPAIILSFLNYNVILEITYRNDWLYKFFFKLQSLNF